MSRLSSFFHKIFGGYSHIFEDVAGAVFMPLVRDFTNHPEWSDADRRSFARSVIADYVGHKWPAYEWLIDEVLDFVIAYLRQRLKTN